MKVYLSKNEKVFGPYSIAQIRQYIEAGNFTLTDKACQDGLNWFTLADAPWIAHEDFQPRPSTSKSPSRMGEKTILQTVLYYCPFFLWTAALLDRELVMLLMLDTYLLSLFPPLAVLALFVVWCQCGFILCTTLGWAIFRLLGFSTRRQSIANWILLAVFSSLLIRACLKVF
jgi:hypothetical protein